jgi:phosphatidate cytidylyltransferase
MELPAVDALRDGLANRVNSGLALAALALVLAYVGGLAFNVLVLAVAGLMAFEWRRLCSGATSRSSRASWLAIGLAYIAVPCMAVVWLRAEPLGRETILWLFTVVWGTDIGAYFAGRRLGGPKLAPRTSPGKTWSGLGGGVAAAAAVGGATAIVLDLPHLPQLVLTSALLALVAQAGDLWESKVKRRFGAKDSGTLIPGHGGVLDRLDGLMAAAPAVVVATFVIRRLGGEGVLAWP